MAPLTPQDALTARRHTEECAPSVVVGVARNVPDTISPRLEEEFPLDFPP